MKAISNLIESIKARIICDMKDVYSVKGDKILKMVLAAYNAFQEEERGGVDYIFDLEKKEDLECCVKGGLTAQEICGLYLGSQSRHLRFFYFGCNYPKPQPIDTWDELRINMESWLDEVLPCVLAYPYSVKAYEDLYRHYVTHVIVDYPNNMSLSDIDALEALKAKLEAMD